MKIKNIDEFTLEDCQKYLASNPSGEMASMVLVRMNTLQRRHKEAEENKIAGFTMAECQQYINSHPNGEYIQIVTERMNRLKAIRKETEERERQQVQSEFETEYIRFYATQQYVLAFTLCLEYIIQNDSNMIDIAVQKAKSVIPMLKNRIVTKTSLSYDWLIDSLAKKGYRNMRYDGKLLRWKSTKILLTTKGYETEITTQYKHPVILDLLLLLLGVFVFFNILHVKDVIRFLVDFMYHIELLNNYHYDVLFEDMHHNWLMISLPTCFLVFIVGMLIILHKVKQHKKVLRQIANVTVEYISKYYRG